MEILLDSARIGLSIVCVSLAAFYLLKRRHKYRNGPPGPIGLPIVGYAPFLGQYPAHTFAKLAKKYGPVLSVDIGMGRRIVLNDYDSVHEALVKHSDVFSGRPYIHLMHRMTDGMGIIMRDYDDNLKTQRKFVIKTLRGFGFGRRSMEDKITEESQYFVELLASKDGKPFDSYDVFANSVSNVICNVVMGSRFSYDDEEFRNMVFMLHRWFTDKRDAVLLVFVILADLLRYIPPFSGAYKRLFQDVDYIFGVLRKILEEHKRTMDVNNPRDFIDAYLKEMQENGEKESSFTELQLLQLIRDFFIAGTETTSASLRWCVFTLARDPDVQEKVSREVKEVIGSGIPSMKHADEMPYTNAFLQEVTRHRTLATLAVPHLTTSDVKFRGYNIPKGTQVWVNLWGVHNDPRHFEDPEQFMPERFIGHDGKFVPDKHVIPFSVGPRYCLGEQLAKMEMFLFLTNIVQRFEILPNPDKPLPRCECGVPGFTEGAHPFEASFRQR